MEENVRAVLASATATSVALSLRCPQVSPIRHDTSKWGKGKNQR